MIVIVAQFETDHDYWIENPEQIGIVAQEEKDEYCGTFLCNDTYEARAVITKLIRHVDSSNDSLYQWFIQTFGEALTILDDADTDPYALRGGWSQWLSGNYGNTHLFMQEIPDSKQEGNS